MSIFDRRFRDMLMMDYATLKIKVVYLMDNKVQQVVY
jgi:hypothetical protein